MSILTEQTGILSTRIHMLPLNMCRCEWKFDEVLLGNWTLYWFSSWLHLISSMTTVESTPKVHTHWDSVNDPS